MERLSLDLVLEKVELSLVLAQREKEMHVTLTFNERHVVHKFVESEILISYTIQHYLTVVTTILAGCQNTFEDLRSADNCLLRTRFGYEY